MKRNLFTRKILFVFCVTLLTALLVACAAKEVNTVPVEDKEKRVKVEKPMLLSMGETLVTKADIVPSQEVSVVAEAEGTMVARKTQIGKLVKKGDILFTIENSSIDLALSKLQLEKEIARKRLDNAKIEYDNSVTLRKMSLEKLEQQKLILEREMERFQQLYEASAIPKKELEAIEDQIKLLALDIKQGKEGYRQLLQNQDLALMEVQLKELDIALQDISLKQDKLQIRAPITGVITELQGAVGMKLRGGEPVAKIESHQPLYARAEIAEHELIYVQNRKSFPLQVTVLNETLDSQLLFISPSPKSGKNGYKMELQIANNHNHKLLPGMSAQLVLSDDRSQEVMTVPNSALFRDADEYHVFTVKEGKAVKTLVEIGRRNKEYVEIISGLTSEDAVVVLGQNQLEDGDIVVVLQ
ncbi:hypothetical protein BHU72_13430 [Desulfuribacillus stibiiarsenatis]|uniref:Uncharacterized protein n=1 Tax=Desulfuribacillus stibiiarsenatis TaxID=1390249 RepID=A0A1E5L8Q8_9FIRM|nr:efflux RND transporter periplasmic adaptor subunit [Desulfuribacillus stibiiarsenatis]OEH86414.1 hypothetical protein BHU72_13430 [Desulfuribacillus stibiiarsenatis]